MKNLFAKCLLFIFCSIFVNAVFSQCNVKIENEDEFTSFSFHPEEITDVNNTIRFKDGGGLVIYLETCAFAKNDGSSVIMSIKIHIGRIKTTSTFAPRKVTLLFENGESTLLEAHTYDIYGADTDVPYYRYEYVLQLSTIQKLSNFDVEKVYFEDTRLNEKEYFIPFKGIFKTQIDCLGKSIKRSVNL